MNSKQLRNDAEFIEATAGNIKRFLEPYISDIGKHYKWPISAKSVEKATKLLNYDFSVERGEYNKTLKLKELVSKRVQECNDFDSTFSYAEFFIKSWGRIGAEKKQQKTDEKLKNLLNKFYLEKDRDLNEFHSIESLERVSSWSKYLSILKPDAAIYDARVAYSINAINFMDGEVRRYFGGPVTRSPKLKVIDIETLFVMQHLANDESFVNEKDIVDRRFSNNLKNKYCLREKMTYRRYLQLLEKVARKLKLGDNERFKVEMLLFALAPTEVLKGLVAHMKAKT